MCRSGRFKHGDGNGRPRRLQAAPWWCMGPMSRPGHGGGAKRHVWGRWWSSKRPIPTSDRPIWVLQKGEFQPPRKYTLLSPLMHPPTAVLVLGTKEAPWRVSGATRPIASRGRQGEWRVAMTEAEYPPVKSDNEHTRALGMAVVLFKCNLRSANRIIHLKFEIATGD